MIKHVLQDYKEGIAFPVFFIKE